MASTRIIGGMAEWEVWRQDGKDHLFCDVGCRNKDWNTVGTLLEWNPNEGGFMPSLINTYKHNGN